MSLVPHKWQKEKIEEAYQKSNEDEITLPDAKSEFTASIIVPEGLTFPAELANLWQKGDV